MARPGPRREDQQDAAPPRLASACRSPGSKVTSVPTSASTASSPLVILRGPPRRRPTRARAPGGRGAPDPGRGGSRSPARRRRSSGRPGRSGRPGASISLTRHDFTAATYRAEPRRETRRGRTLAVVPPVVDQLPLGPLATNCYLVRADRAAPEAVVVDPSGTAAEIRLELASRGAALRRDPRHPLPLRPRSRAGRPRGGDRRARPCAGGGARGARGSPSTSPARLPLRAWTPDVLLEGGETLELAGVTFDVVPVPGHSPGHVAYAIDGAVLSGDVLFAGSVGRTDLPGADWQTLLDSISALVDRCPPRPRCTRDTGRPRRSATSSLEPVPRRAAARAPEPTG